jgi:hypothetical protein
MVTSLGVAVPSSGAAGSSAFCKTMLTYKPVSPPTKMTTANYHLWAKAYLPLFKKLASEAPSAKTKSALNELVTILNYEATSTSISGLAAYISANRTQYANGFLALTKSLMSCAF